MRHSHPLLRLTLQHFEKAIFGAACAWFGVAGLAFAQDPEGLNPETARSWKAVQHYMDNWEPDDQPVPERTEELRAQLRPSAEALETESFPAWVMHRAPMFLYDTEPGPGDDDVEFTHEGSLILDVDAARRGRITITWKPGTCSDTLIPSYELQRQEQDGEWKTIADLREGVEEHVDDAVKPERRYAYRVLSTARLNREHVRIDTLGITSFPEELERVEGDRSARATTPRNVGITVNTVSPGDPIKRRQGTAQLTVHAWNPKREAFETKIVFVREGQAIGKGRFATGATLERVWVETRGVRKVEFVELRRPGHPAETLNDREPFVH